MENIKLALEQKIKNTNVACLKDQDKEIVGKKEIAENKNLCGYGSCK